MSQSPLSLINNGERAITSFWKEVITSVVTFANGGKIFIGVSNNTEKKTNTYNIYRKNKKTKFQIVYTICSILNKKVPTDKSYKELTTFIENRAKYNRHYTNDATKLENKIKWKADKDFDSRIIKTIKLYLRKIRTKEK